VDTAQAYGNERGVGRAIEDSDVDRDEIFLTTKVLPQHARYDDLLDAVAGSLARLHVDSVDLLLLHWPNPVVDVEETLAAMSRLRDEGKVHHVGVSNFSKSRLERARELSDAPILTDQVHFHPFYPQRSLLRYCQDEDVLLTAYSPLAHGGVVADETLARIGRKYDRSAAQVALRWATQHRNVVAIPKSTTEAHLRANLDVFGFTLTRDEIDEITRPSYLKTGAAYLRGRFGV
jgi:diketogulonate reductase-like aldo/keto reductase